MGKKLLFYGSYFFIVVALTALTGYLGCFLYACMVSLPLLGCLIFVLTMIYSVVHFHLWKSSLSWLYFFFCVVAPVVAVILMIPMGMYQSKIAIEQDAQRDKKAREIHLVSVSNNQVIYAGNDYGFRLVLPATFSLREQYITSRASDSVTDAMAVVTVAMPHGESLKIDSMKNYIDSTDFFKRFPGLSWLTPSPTTQIFPETRFGRTVYVIKQQTETISYISYYILTPTRNIRIETQFSPHNEHLFQQDFATFLQGIEIIDTK